MSPVRLRRRQPVRGRIKPDSFIRVVEDAGSIELEMPENAMLIDEGEAIRCLDPLERYGAGIALDDSGTGYSSLRYVRRFPVDPLKIDRAFAEAIESDPEAQAELLRAERCDELLGYLYSPPKAARQITRAPHARHPLNSDPRAPSFPLDTKTEY